MHSPNSCFLGPTRVQIPSAISIGTAIFAQLTAECPYAPILYNGPSTPAPSPLKIVPSPSHGGSARHLIHHGFMGPPKSSTQTTSRSVQPFCRAHYNDGPTDRPTDLSCLTSVVSELTFTVGELVSRRVGVPACRP